MEVIVMSPEHPFPLETEWVNSMVEAGLSRFHLRRTFNTADDQMRYLELFDKTVREKIIVHQYQEHVLSHGMKQVHIKAQERNEKKLAHYWQHCSTSFHKIDELNQQGGAFNYCFISPLFDSLSKPGYKGHTSLQSEVKDVPFPVYALGGITIHTVTALKGGGFKGVAAIGAIWQNNPLEQYLRLKEACHGL